MNANVRNSSILIWMVLSFLSALMLAKPAHGLEILEIDCVGAAPHGTSIHIEADVNGPAVVMAPFIARDEEIGMLTPVIAEGSLRATGDRITGTLKASIRRLSRVEDDKAGPLPVELAIDAASNAGVVSGTWTAKDGSKGLIAGFRRKIAPVADCDVGGLAMVTAYPAEGRVLGLGMGGNQHQIGAAFTVRGGAISDGKMFPGANRPSFYPVKRFTPAQWVASDGTVMHYSGAGLGENDPATGAADDPFTEVSASGTVTADAMEVVLVAQWRGKKNEWKSKLIRTGALWHGTWTWNVPGMPEASAVAVARLGSTKQVDGNQTAGKDPRSILLRHALALSRHPSGCAWRDVVSAQAVRGNGNKQYDNAPNIVAAGITIGLLIDRLSSDPLQRAEGMAIARRAACWGQTARFGKLRVGEYYKGMFWVTAWAGTAMAELAEREPEGPWKAMAADYARMQSEQQLASGAWTWVDEETGERGHSNERGDRSLDNRELNGGDILLSMARCAQVSGVDCAESQRKAVSWLVSQFGKEQQVYSEAKADKKARKDKSPESEADHGDNGAGVLAFYQDRRPGASKDAFPSVSFLLYLAEQDKPDLSAAAQVRQAIEREFASGKDGLLNGYFPRAAPGDPAQNLDYASSARYAHALALLAKKGDGSARSRAERLMSDILAKAGAASGIIDHYGRDLPVDLAALALTDSHSYLCLKASIAWDLADAMDAMKP